MPEASQTKQQAPQPPDPRQEAERQRKEKERMEAENHRRREVLRRQAEKDATSARLARAFEDMDQREKENEDTWDLYY